MDFKQQYQDWQTLQGLYDTRAEWWEEVKGKIKGFFVRAGKARREKDRRVWAGLQRCLNRYSALLRGGFDFHEEVGEVRREMAALAEKRGQEIMFRSREKEIEEGETCSRYFFKKMMAKGAAMKGLKGEDGVVATDREEMVGIVEAFYTHFFAKKEVVEERLEEVLGFIENVVEDGAELEAELSMVDVNNSLRSFKSGKAPGVDRLPAEFYKAFWEVVGLDLLCVFKEVARKFKERGGDPPL